MLVRCGRCALSHPPPYMLVFVSARSYLTASPLRLKFVLPTPPPGNPKYKKTMDGILNDVMTEAIAQRDKGEKVDSEYINRRFHERVFEQEYGRPAPSKQTAHLHHIPMLPEENVRRLTPFTLFDQDPWPQRSFASPADRKREAEQGTAAVPPPTADANPPPPPAGSTNALAEINPKDEFLDAFDEIAFWELKYIDFLRDVPLGQRRSLPIFFDMYKHLTHRLVRAENRFIAARERLLGKAKIRPSSYAATERVVQQVRDIYVETHKSLQRRSYDPLKAKHCVSGQLMQLSPQQYVEWKEIQRRERALVLDDFMKEDEELKMQDMDGQGKDKREETGKQGAASTPQQPQTDSPK